MKTIALFLAISAAYLGASWADEPPSPVDQEKPQVDPNTGKLWDGESMQWLTPERYFQVLKSRGVRQAVQVHFVEPVIRDGEAVLSRFITARDRALQADYLASVSGRVKAQRLHDASLKTFNSWGVQ